MSTTEEKVIIVEGRTDKRRISPLLDEPVSIVCTEGTLSYEQEEMFARTYFNRDVYILTDADAPGMKLRKQLTQILPAARHLYTRRMYREVATTPIDILIEILQAAHFELNPDYIDPNLDFS